MRYETFDKLLDQMVEEEKAIGKIKGDEYTQGDRLDNFTRLAKELNLTAKQVLWVYLKKHLDSIASYIKDEAESRKTGKPMKELSEPIEGRVKDARVYLSLLRALIEVERDTPVSKG